MAVYTVTVSTGSQRFTSTDDDVYITLVGTERSSERTLLDKPQYDDFKRGAANATGGGGHVELVQRAMKTLTFRSLCFPDIIKSRGLDNKEELPTYFYRDDGYLVWEAIMGFVSDVVHIYYKDDEAVREDEEIQAFVKDVRGFGMQDFDHCGRFCASNFLQTS